MRKSCSLTSLTILVVLDELCNKIKVFIGNAAEQFSEDFVLSLKWDVISDSFRHSIDFGLLCIVALLLLALLNLLIYARDECTDFICSTCPLFLVRFALCLIVRVGKKFDVHDFKIIDSDGQVVLIRFATSHTLAPVLNIFP